MVAPLTRSRIPGPPIGVRQETVGDTSIGYADSGGLYLTDADRALIDGYGPQVAFVVDTLPARPAAGLAVVVGARLGQRT